MFTDRYPRAATLHARVLQSYGSPRGLTITPIPGPPVDPPEIVHENSSVFVSQVPNVVFVVEWSGSGEPELHHCFL